MKLISICLKQPVCYKIAPHLTLNPQKLMASRIDYSAPFIPNNIQRSQSELFQDAANLISQDKDEEAAALVRHLNRDWINARQRDGSALIHLAVRKGLMKTVYTLWQYRADLEQRDLERKTPLENAISCHQNEMILLLLPKVNVNAINEEGQSYLHVAVLKENLHGVHYLLQQPMMDPNQRDPSGETALHYAVRYNPNVDIILQLLHHPRLDPTVLDINGQSALHRAVETNNAQIIDMWIRAQRPLDILDGPNWETPLHRAVQLSLDPIAALLTQGGADIYRPNRLHVTPAGIAQAKERAERESLT